MPVYGYKCNDCGMALQQSAVEALGNDKVGLRWVEDGTSSWTCDQTGEDHRPVPGDGMRYFEVEFTKTVHVIADNEEAAYQQAEAEVVSHVLSTGVVDWSNYDDCVRRITKAEY